MKLLKVYLININSQTTASTPSTQEILALFVEVDPRTGSGYIHKLVGSITGTSHHERIPSTDPLRWKRCTSKSMLGYVDMARYPSGWDDVLDDFIGTFGTATLLPGLRGLSMDAPAADGAGSLVPIKPANWVFERAIPVLKREGLLLDTSFVQFVRV